MDAPAPGRTTRRMPAKPTMMASHRSSPTRSPRSGPAKSATKKGMENMMDTVWSNCRNWRAVKLSAVVENSSAERTICSTGRVVRISPGTVQGLNTTSESAKWMT